MKQCFVYFAMGVAVLLLAHSAVLAQEEQPLPDGTTVQGTLGETIGWSSNSIWRREGGLGKRWRHLWSPPKGLRIYAVGEKWHINADGERNVSAYFILLSDGSVYSWTPAETIWEAVLFPRMVQYRTQIPNVSSGGLREVIGDDLYARSSDAVYVSRDGGSTWNVDTAGLNGAAPRNMALDSLQNVYLATDRGLYKQGLTENVWQKMNSMTKSLNSVFVDRRDKWLYVGTSNEGIYKSSNFGASWQQDSAGTGTAQIFLFADDALGNIYARGSGSLFRSTGGTQPWVRIDAGLRSRSSSGTITISRVSADTALLVATNFGIFESTDQGATWTETRGASSDNAYGMVVLPSGRTVVTTDLGIFVRNAGSTSWSRSYPATTYQFVLNPLQRDKNGVLYTSANFDILKSTNNGDTWSIDLPGWGSPLPAWPGNLFVDENGVQHYLPRSTVQTIGSIANWVYMKSGGSWVPDQNGLTVSANESFYGYASDRQGSLFLFRNSATNPKVMRRPIGGGTWVADTTGTSGAVFLSMTTDRFGNMIAGAQGGGIYRRSNGVWSRLQTPQAVSTSHVPFVSVDSTNALFAAFSNDTPPFFFTTRGVYFTKDNGASWTYAGLDSLGLRGLVSYGDSTFALTLGRGVKILRSTPVAFFLARGLALSFGTVSVGQAKNLQIALSNTGTDSLRITNITSSQAVFTPLQTRLTIGPHQTSSVAVRFSPTTATLYLGSIVVVSNSPSSPDTIPAAGIGATPSNVQKLEGIPTEFSLSQNFPNPFNPTTTIRYGIPAHANVRLEVYNLLGQLVVTLVDEEQMPAFYQVQWDAQGLSSGLYYYRLVTGSFIQTRKLLLLK